MKSSLFTLALKSIAARQTPATTASPKKQLTTLGYCVENRRNNFNG